MREPPGADDPELGRRSVAVVGGGDLAGRGPVRGAPRPALREDVGGARRRVDDHEVEAVAAVRGRRRGARRPGATRPGSGRLPRRSAAGRRHRRRRPGAARRSRCARRRRPRANRPATTPGCGRACAGCR